MSNPSPPSPIFVLHNSDVNRGEITSLHFINFSSEHYGLLSGHDNGFIVLWDIQTRRVKRSWQAHGCKSVLWLNHYEDKVLSYGRNALLVFWMITDCEFKIFRKLSIEHLGFCTCDLTVFESSTFLAVPHIQGTVKILNVSDNLSTLNSLRDEGILERNNVMCLQFISVPEAGYKCCMCVGYESGLVVIWNVLSAKILYSFDYCKEPIICMDFDSGRMRGICGSVDTKITVWNLVEPEGNVLLKLLSEIKIKNPGTSCIRVRPDGKLFATGGWDNRIRIFSLKTLKPLAVLDFHKGSVLCCLFFSMENDGKIYMAAGSKDKLITIWDLYNDR